MSEEKVNTDSEFGEIEAYLVEARSIGGLSGSPVFLNLNRPRVKKGTLLLSGGGLWLLGLVHGHVDVKGHLVDTDAPSDTSSKPISVNTGIATVVPVSKISETVVAFEADLPPPVLIPDARWPEDAE